jgi:hypothetical protein
VSVPARAPASSGLAIGMMLVAMMLFTTMDTIGKLLSAH